MENNGEGRGCVNTAGRIAFYGAHSVCFYG